MSDAPVEAPKPAIRGRWVKGQSGNPSGRTRCHEDAAKRAARYIDDLTDGGQAMIRRLVELGIEQPATSAADRRIAVAACEILLERWAGKPRQEISIAVDGVTAGAGTAVRQLSDAQLEAIAALDAAEAAAGELEAGESQ